MDGYDAFWLTERWLAGRATLDCDEGMKKIWSDAVTFSGGNLSDLLRDITYEGIRAGRVWEKDEICH